MLVAYLIESPDVGRVTQIMLSPTQKEKDNEENLNLEDTIMIYPDEVPGMCAVLKVNLTDKTLFYDYYAPETIETRVFDLQQENSELNMTIGNLLLENANDKATISVLEETMGNLLLEVAALKGGAA